MISGTLATWSPARKAAKAKANGACACRESVSGGGDDRLGAAEAVDYAVATEDDHGVE